MLIELHGLKRVSAILEDELRSIHGDLFKSFEVQSVMKYPMNGSRYVVVYDLKVEGQLPIVRAKTVVDISRGTLERFEPDLL
jgi:hypothetical protein